jgi:hypothetical protein
VTVGGTLKHPGAPQGERPALSGRRVCLILRQAQDDRLSEKYVFFPREFPFRSAQLFRAKKKGEILSDFSLFKNVAQKLFLLLSGLLGRLFRGFLLSCHLESPPFHSHERRESVQIEIDHCD